MARLWCMVESGGIIPRHMGVAYRSETHEAAMCVLLPFNWLVRWWRELRFSLAHPGRDGWEKYWSKGWDAGLASGVTFVEKEKHRAYDDGYRKGLAAGREDAAAARQVGPSMARIFADLEREIDKRKTT